MFNIDLITLLCYFRSLYYIICTLYFIIIHWWYSNITGRCNMASHMFLWVSRQFFMSYCPFLVLNVTKLFFQIKSNYESSGYGVWIHLITVALGVDCRSCGWIFASQGCKWFLLCLQGLKARSLVPGSEESFMIMLSGVGLLPWSSR